MKQRDFHRSLCASGGEAASRTLYYVVGDDATQSLAHKERMKDRIQAKVDELDLHHHVKLLGRVSDEDPFHLYFLAEIFVLPCLEIPGGCRGVWHRFFEAALTGTAQRGHTQRHHS